MKQLVHIAIILSLLYFSTTCFQLTQQIPLLSIDSSQSNQLERKNNTYFTVLNQTRHYECVWYTGCVGQVTAVVKALKDVEIWETKQQIVHSSGQPPIIKVHKSFVKTKFVKDNSYTFYIKYEQGPLQMWLYIIEKELYYNHLGIKVFELNLGWNEQ